MNTNFETSYHINEKHHFWFKARRSFVKQLLYETSKDSKILDIGCSSGVLIQDLIDCGFNANNIHGIDISERAIERSKVLGIKQTQIMDAQNIKFSHTFDLLIASDCLEHLKNDNQALHNWYNLLNPGGKLIVFVPAYQFLWSRHDEANNHYRRYTKLGLKRKLIASNFIIEKASYWNTLLFLPIALVRLFNKLFLSKAKTNTSTLKTPVGNTLFYSILKLENKLLSKISFPFGVSTFCVVTKPKK
ncbi:class I SAM-dependent methyltransferase [Winogradskyella immobilis]|uniref:Class I SAM-dependent methyltransferase n=1 Tax=Winogradskyella immobilis TaxID=2816852 RepID=A0ABS8EL97_9FLAO|nr:class I SAM-dependent methyltransferase [Winogradskyella immobilis]MCC1483701.1 class I SAM-dependent methyltransferase [Winogradskyella immobilis]MCG0015795.1 class I SAM-dependent methyltransferase [Winogradskyella immobilis]